MSVERQAAEGRTDIWRGHDEEDSELAVNGAKNLYSALTGEDKDSYSIRIAAEMTKDAFWIADQAEEHMRNGEEDKEEQMYKRCARLLKEARDFAGLPWESMEYRGEGWWKAYRRGDKEKIREYVMQEHESDLDPEDVESATKELFGAFEHHDGDDWDKVADCLEDFYEIAAPELRN